MATELAPVTVEGTPAAPAPPPIHAYQPLPGMVEITDPDGSISNVRAEDLQAALAEGAHTTTQTEEFRRRAGTTGQIMAGLTGAARGLTFGVSDPLTVGVSELLEGPDEAEKTRETLRLLKEGYDNSSLIGEIGGSLLPLALGAGPGGGGAAVTGESFLARAGQRAVQAAPRALMEGAAIGMGQQLSEDTLGSHDVVADKYLNAGVEGGVLGLILGAGLAAGGGAVADKLGSRATRATGEKSALSFVPHPNAAENEVTVMVDAKALDRAWKRDQSFYIGRGAEGIKGRREGVERFLAKGEPIQAPRVSMTDSGVATFTDGRHRFATLRDRGVGRVAITMPEEEALRLPREWKVSPLGEGAPVATLGERLGGEAERQAFKATGAKLGVWQRLGETADDIDREARRLGRFALDEGIVTAGASQGDMAQRVTRRAVETGEELGKLRSTLDTSAIRPLTSEIAERFENEVAREWRQLPLGESELAPAERFLKSMVTKSGETQSYTKLWKNIRRLDDMLERGGEYSRLPTAPTKAGADALRQLRGVMRSVFDDAAERAAVDLGDDVASKYRVARARYADLAKLEEITSKEVARAEANRAVSLTDTIAATQGAAAHGPAGLLWGFVNKTLRERGNMIAAVSLDKMSKLEMLQRSQAKFDSKLEGSVSSYFTGKRPGAAAREVTKVTPEQRKALREAISNPAALTERVGDQLAASGMREAAPKVTQAAVASVMRAAAYLQQRLPSEPRPTGLVFGKERPRAVGLRAQAELDNAVRALDVDKTLDDFAKGRLDRQAWEAIRIVNPPLFQEMVGKIQRFAIENQPAMDRQKLVALSIVTGQPLTPYMEPKTIRGLQQAYAAAGPAGPTPSPTQPGVTDPKPMGGGGGGGGKSRSAAAFTSGSDRLEASNDVL